MYVENEQEALELEQIDLNEGGQMYDDHFAGHPKYKDWSCPYCMTNETG